MSEYRSQPQRALLEHVQALYDRGADEHGTSPQAVGWNDEGSQRLRFEKLVQVIRPEDPSVTVNDLGCGYGALFPYLESVPWVTLTKYFGYDISRKMLSAARAHIADVRAELIESSFINLAADYSFASGIFNVNLSEDEDAWLEHIKLTLENMAEFSRLGFAFNALTTYVDWRDDSLYYADPFHFFEFCKREISPYVALLHDYPLYEWTLLVRKSS